MSTQAKRVAPAAGTIAANLAVGIHTCRPATATRLPNDGTPGFAPTYGAVSVEDLS